MYALLRLVIASLESFGKEKEEKTDRWTGRERDGVALTQQQFDELQAAGFDFCNHHILALSSDRDSIVEALESLPRRRQPRLSAHYQTKGAQPQSNDPAGASAEHGEPRELEEEFQNDEAVSMVVMEHGFRTDSSVGFPQWEDAMRLKKLGRKPWQSAYEVYGGSLRTELRQAGRQTDSQTCQHS